MLVQRYDPAGKATGGLLRGGWSSSAVAKESGQPFRVEAVRPIQMSTRDAVDTFVEGRGHFTVEQWRDLLLRSVGFEPSRFTPRQQDVLLARMVPFVVSNYNAVELGPRGTGKSSSGFQTRSSGTLPPSLTSSMRKPRGRASSNVTYSATGFRSGKTGTIVIPRRVTGSPS
jgi:Putative ATP-dependent Lon protease